MDFKPGQLLTSIRNKSDEVVNLPREGYTLKNYKIPLKFRKRAYMYIKEKVSKDLGFNHKYNYAFENEDNLNLELCYKGSSLDEGGQDKPILYFHGGAYIMCSINTHRNLTSNLAHNADAKLFSLNYRLAPEHPFPSALEDALAAYLFLTTPKSNNVGGLGLKPEDIVVAGDSAGGGLAMSFTLLLRDLQDQKYKLGMIAGSLLMSPWVDLTSSLPSFLQNSNFDYLPGPDILQRNAFNPSKANKTGSTKPYDFITKMVVSGCPQLQPIIDNRGHFFTYEAWLKYHLVSPLFADSFHDLPPILITVGHDERLRDEAILLAHKIRKTKSNSNSSQSENELPPVQLYSFDEMPHVFQLFAFNPTAQLSLKLAGEFIRNCHSSTPIQHKNDKLARYDDEEKFEDGEDNLVLKCKSNGWAWFIKPNFESSEYNFEIHKEFLS